MKKEKKIKKEKTAEENKEKLGTKFINTIKKRWLISRTNTILLIAILVAIVVLINSFVSSLELTPIDCTTNKEYTLTDLSKEKIKDIDSDINIYFVGYGEDSTEYTLAKQYNKVNPKINVEIVNTEERIDLVDKYGLTDDYYVIIIENGDRSKMLSSSDLYTTDGNMETMDLTEEKFTSSILNVISEDVPKVYFLEGYSNYTLDYGGGMYYLSVYLDNEVLEYERLNLLKTGKIPDDCDTLVITTPTKDFDDLTKTEIREYIKRGGNILWLNSAYGEKLELTNVNKILAEYGLNPFDVGYIYETDEDRVLLNLQSCIVEDAIGYTKIDEHLKDYALLTCTKINVNEEKKGELGIEEEDLITSGETSYFRSNVANTSTSTDGDEQGSFVIGSIFTRKIEDSSEESEEKEDEENNDEEEKDEKTSKLIIIGNQEFITDNQIASNIMPMIYIENNKDLVLNSISYLTDQDVGISIRKSHTSTSNFTATDAQRSLIMKVIFIIPIAIIIVGIIVWQVRRRKK